MCHGVFNAVTLLPTLFLDISKYQDTLLFNDRDRVQFQLADLISKSDSTDDNVEYNELLSFSQTGSLDDIRAIKEVIDSNIKALDSCDKKQ